jgi:hypothetical protein
MRYGRRMRGLMSTKPWQELNARLLAATDRDFERAVLPLLRCMWPDLEQCPARKDYDNRGVDLISFSRDDTIACAIQCKGFFKIEGLADDQFFPIKDSIEKFRNSGLHTKTYILIHNQDARNRNVANKIDGLLKQLVSEGVADEALQWDRHELFDALQKRLWEMLDDRIAEQAKMQLDQASRRFRLTEDHVAAVPLKRRHLTLKRGDQAQLTELALLTPRRTVAAAIAEDRSHWTLLIGLFGSGKTTACLAASTLPNDRFIYVPASALEPARGEMGTNVLMEKLLQALSVYADFRDDDRKEFERLASAMLRKDLSENDSNAILIIDGLDENRSLSGPVNMTRLASTLAELRCRIVLSTRSEHFNAAFGNYDHLFDELAIKGVPGNIPVIELGDWDWEQIAELARHAIAKEPGNSKLENFLSAVERQSTAGWDEELLRHPLFLSMILELVANGNDPTSNLAGIIHSWIRQKLIRDLKVARLVPVEIADRDVFLDQTMRLMSDVAAEMTETGETGAIELTEVLNSTTVLEKAEAIYGQTGIALHSIVGTSLLIPLSARYWTSVSMRFSHRIFQEYFLAAHLAERGLSANAYPEAVQNLHQAMVA